MAALFWVSPLRLSHEAWALYPTWSKGLSAMRAMLVDALMKRSGIGRARAYWLVRQSGFPKL